MALTCPSCGYVNRDDAAYCGMCKAVFGGKASGKSPPRPRPGAAPGPASTAPAPATTRLDHPAIARELAARPDPFLASFGVVLDRSLASIRMLDFFIDETWGTEGEALDDDSYRPSQSKINVIVGFGSYLGEVVREHIGGAWQDDPAHPGNPTAAAVVMGGSRAFPVAKVYKRFRDGASDSLHQLARYLIRELAPELLATTADGYEKQAEHFLAASRLPDERIQEIAIELLRTAADVDPSRAARLEPQLARLIAGDLGRARRAAPPEPAPAAYPAPPEPPVATSSPAAPPATPPAPPPPSASAHQHRSLDKLIAGELDDALDELRLWAHAEDPTLDSPGWLARADGLPADTGLGTLLVHYGASVALEPDAIEGWRELGVGLAMWGSMEAALAALDRALALAPEDATTWNHKGVTYMRMNRAADALACWDRAIAADPRDAGAWRNRGAALLKLGRTTEEALEAFERSLTLEPDHVKALYSRGECELALERSDAAARSFRRILELPGATPVHRDAAQRHLARIAARG